MKTPFVLTLALLFAALLSGCVAIPEKIADTRSGFPEVVIAAEPSVIRGAIVSAMMDMGLGYTLESESDSLLRFSRKLTGGEDFGAALMVGNSYSTNRKVATFTLAKQPDGTVRVVASVAITAQMPGGQVNSVEIANNNEAFNKGQAMLWELKRRIEGART